MMMLQVYPQSRTSPKRPGSHTNREEDYYEFAPKGFHIIGYDGAGIVLETGPECQFFKPGDEISYVGASTRQGSYAEYQLVSELHCACKPKSLDFVQAASFGLTFGTAYQSLHHRLNIKPNENVGILIVSWTSSRPTCASSFTPADISLTDIDQWCWRSWQCCYPAGAQCLESSCSRYYCISARNNILL
jgi:hypothetical protein